MYSNRQTHTQEVSHADEDDVSMTESETEYDTEDCFIDSIAREVQKGIIRETKHDDDDDEWNITVMLHFDEVFESVPMTKVWRRFLLTLYSNQLPINTQMIDDITGHYTGYKSAVLNSVLQLAPPTKQWDTTDDAEEDETDDETAEESDEANSADESVTNEDISDTDTAY